MTPQSTFDRQPSHNAFVGREREMAELRAGLDDVSAGHGRLFLLSGEPGIGKTRLADEFARVAAAQGARVVWGRCWEGGGAPAYWPLVQIIRNILGDLSDEERARLSSGTDSQRIAREIGQIVPEFAPAPADAGELAMRRTQQDLEQARFRLFDAVAALVANSAKSKPLVTIVDDLHDADEPSLQMLKFVARDLKNSPVLVIAAYRDVEVRQSDGLKRLLGDIRREGIELSLRGLDLADVASIIWQHSGFVGQEKLATEVHLATAGNPLFVDGIVRVLASEGKLDGRTRLDLTQFKVPDGVREPVRRTLAMLSADANQALTVAAAFGNEFDLNVVCRTLGLSAEQLLLLLDPAARAGLVMALTSARWRFAHAVVRATIYDEIPIAARIQLHRTIGALLEDIYRDDQQSHLSELACHFKVAARSGDSEKAIDYSVRAGAAEFAVFGFEEAASHWHTALELIDEQGGGDPQRRARILWELSNDLVSPGATAVEYCKAALKLFEASGSSEEIVLAHSRLATYLSGPSQGVMNVPLAMEHFRKAEAHLTEKSPVGLITYYINMAFAWSYAMRTEEGLIAARNAMETSERFGSDLGWAWGAVFCSYFLIWKGSIAEGLNLAERARKSAETIGDVGLGPAVATLGGLDYALLNDLPSAQAWFASGLANPSTKQAPIQRQMLVGLIALHAPDLGEFAEARRALADAGVDEPPVYFLWMEGPWERASRAWVRALERHRNSGNRSEETNELRLYGRFLYSRGEFAGAAAALEKSLARSLEGGHIVYELWTRLELVWVFLDLQRSADALSQLERCRAIVANGEDWRGTAARMARAEGVFAAAERNYSKAETKFQQSISICRRYSLLWDEAETLFHWGRALLAASNRDRAAEKFDDAIKIYESHGFATEWIDRVMAERILTVESLASAASKENHGSAEESGRQSVTQGNDQTSVAGQFRKEGHYWTVSLGGETFRLKDSKSLRVIAHLIRNPGHQFHARELAALNSPSQPVAPHFDENVGATVSSDLGDAGIVLDARAVAEYRHRLEDLGPEIEVAERCNDLGRVSLLREEAEVLTAELASGVGFQGRERRTSSHSERARLSVRNNISNAIEKIREASPALGRHLANSIKTGHLCSYSPDPANPIVWRS